MQDQRRMWASGKRVGHKETVKSRITQKRKKNKVGMGDCHQTYTEHRNKYEWWLPSALLLPFPDWSGRGRPQEGRSLLLACHLVISFSILFSTPCLSIDFWIKFSYLSGITSSLKVLPVPSFLPWKGWPLCLSSSLPWGHCTSACAVRDIRAHRGA